MYFQLGIIGYLAGTSIAFFVVMGDLGPPLLAELTGAEQTHNLRLVILVGQSKPQARLPCRSV